MKAPRIGVCASLLLGLLSSDVWANDDERAGQPAPLDESTVQARDHFLRGTALVTEAQWSEALTAFERSLRLRPHPVTRYNVGACLRAMGRYLEARRHFAKALANGRTGGDDQLPETLVAESEAFLREIDGVIVHLAIDLEPRSASIAIDGRPLEPHGDHEGKPVMLAGTLPAGEGKKAPASKFEILIDPGLHVITLSRPGFSNAVVNETFRPGESRDLHLEIDELPATMLIDASQDEAVVTVDGRDVGFAPVSLSRPGGSYKLTVEKDGFVSYETTAKVDPGEVWKVRAELPEREPALYERWWFWGSVGVVVTTTVLVTYFATRPDPTRPPLDGGTLGWAVELP